MSKEKTQKSPTTRILLSILVGLLVGLLLAIIIIIVVLPFGGQVYMKLTDPNIEIIDVFPTTVQYNAPADLKPGYIKMDAPPTEFILNVKIQNSGKECNLELQSADGSYIWMDENQAKDKGITLSKGETDTFPIKMLISKGVTAEPSPLIEEIHIVLNCNTGKHSSQDTENVMITVNTVRVS